MVKLQTLKLTGPNGEIYEAALFPGFGTSENLAARGNHGHLASEIVETIDKLFASPTEKELWGDKYSKLEIDNKIKALVENIDWKESVNTFADIATTYPTPEKGWTVNTKEGNGKTYRFNGLEWVDISSSSVIPLATASLDGLLSKGDYSLLHSIVSFPGFGTTADFAARGNHNHDGVYQPIGAYAAAVHTHDVVAGYSVNAETNADANKLVRTDDNGKIQGIFKLTNPSNDDISNIASLPYIDDSGNIQKSSLANFRVKVLDSFYAAKVHTHDIVGGITVSNTFTSNPLESMLGISGNTAYKYTAAQLQAFLDVMTNASFTGTSILTKLKDVDGIGSGLDADLFQGMTPKSFLPKGFYKESLANGYLVQTTISTLANTTVQLEIVGQMYDVVMPLYQYAQLSVNSTLGKIENFSSILLSGTSPVEISAFSYNNSLYFFIPKQSIKQTLRFICRQSTTDNSTLNNNNRVYDVIDAAIPAGITMLNTLLTANVIKSYNSYNLNLANYVLGTDARLTNARPASDVYDWAKAATKPTYGASEIKFADNQSFQDKLNAGILNGKSAYQAFLDGGGTGLTEGQFNTILSTYANKFNTGIVPVNIVSAQSILEKIGIDQIGYVENVLATTGNAYIDSLPAASKVSIAKFLQLLSLNKLDIKLPTGKILMGVNDVATETDAVYEWTVGASIPGQKENKGLITEMVIADGSIVAMPNIFIKNITLTAAAQIQLLSDSYAGRYYVIESISLIARNINITQYPIFSIGTNASSYNDITTSQVMSGIKNGLNTVVLTTGAWTGLVQANNPMFLNITQPLIGSGSYQLIIKGYLTSI